MRRLSESKRGELAVQAADMAEINQARSVKSFKYNEAKSSISFVLSIFLFTLIVINLIKVALGSNTVTFTGFLNYLSSFGSTFSVPNLKSCLSTFTINKSWGILDDLRQFFNLCAKPLGIIYYLFSNLLYLLEFLSNIIVFLLF